MIGDFFGGSVAIYGNYAIVGSPGYPGDEKNKGKVYWYERQRNGEWTEMHTKEGENDGDGFGSRVDIYGNYAIVGSSGYPGDETDKGKVYWYERQRNGEWTKMHHKEGEINLDFFGSSVAIHGNYAIVGAPGYPGTNKGKVYWYERQRNGEWTEMYSREGKNNSDYFGWSVGIYGNYAIVGAPGYPGGVFKGKVYWYERQRNGEWREMHHKEGENNGDYFGYSVGIYGNYAIVGANGDGDGGDKAHIYQRKNNGNWEEISVKVNPIDGETDFGYNVAIFKNYAMVGGLEGGTVTDSGMAVIYNRENNFWGNS